ncbi:Phenylacetic acid degradation protein PaaD [Lysobacter dokdonensis DS-58]|uniref:Phenylacetic acid degradation protein PaaD n=1 Tax=Lysobacter dokdonensis DS-58 TaxID=1300345 RepID=A0A0A2X053_9GAMM|nr:PaaI family thioesterase [Lysobacter dokdonensis]KGQ18599.1 Phenylacetic acid degradation protein PaaD [Lysobacter dokdonensis DS-58]
MRDIQKIVSDSFAAQGLMQHLGARLVSIEPGEVRIAMAPSPEISQQNGFVHAGALTAILDSACGYAALTMAPDGSDVLTAEFKVNLLRPAVADEFVAIGKVVKAGRTLTVCTSEVIGVRGGESKTIAIMQATIANLANSG